MPCHAHIRKQSIPLNERIGSWSYGMMWPILLLLLRILVWNGTASQPSGQEWIRQALHYPYDYQSYSMSIAMKSSRLVNFALKKKLRNKIDNYLPWKSSNISLWDLFPPSYNCAFRERVGKIASNGSVICNPGAFTPRYSGCNVFSFDTRAIPLFGFEDNLVKTTSCTVRYFNPHVHPTERDSIVSGSTCKRSCGSLHISNISLSSANYTNASGYEFRTLTDVMATLETSRIDILKMHMGGAEWEIFKELAVSGSLQFVDQLVLKLHFDEHRNTVAEVLQLFEVCYTAGLYPFANEVSYYESGVMSLKPGVVEYSFIRPLSRPLLAFPIIRIKCKCGLAGDMLYMKVEDSFPHKFDEDIPYYPKPYVKYSLRVYKHAQSIVNISLANMGYPRSGVNENTKQLQAYADGKDALPFYLWDLFPAAYNCPFRERVGSFARGGSSLCNPGVFARTPCVVFIFSVGARKGSSFEHDLALTTSCVIYLSDPLMVLSKSTEKRYWRQCKIGGCGGEVRLDNFLLGITNGTQPNGWVALTLQAFIARRNVSRLDILKIDILGNEWDVFKELAGSRSLELVDQLVLILHFEEGRNTVSDVFELFDICEAAGLYPFARELSYYEPAVSNEKPNVMEYSFMRADSIASISKPFVRSKCRCGSPRKMGPVSCRNPRHRKATAVLSRTHSNFSDYTPLIIRTKAILACTWASEYDHIIFHDGTMPSKDQMGIIESVGFMDLIFADVGNLFSFRREYPIANATRLTEKHLCPPYVDEKKSDGYYIMCSFWFSDVMDTTCGKHYQYLLRIDDDAIIKISEVDPAMPPDIPFASPAYQGMDYYRVIVGLGRFFRRFSIDKLGRAIGAVWPYKEWDSPYSNVMWLNLEYLRRSKIYFVIRREIDNSKCILSSRWGDLPLWGAVAQALGFNVNTTYLNISYQHYSLQHSVTPGKKIQLALKDELNPLGLDSINL